MKKNPPPTPPPPRPVWIRLPKAYCPITGLSRAKLYQLISKKPAKVRSVVVKGDKGKDRGTRLIDLASLLAWLDSEATAQAMEANQ